MRFLQINMDSERKQDIGQRGGKEERGSPEVYWEEMWCGNMMIPRLEGRELLLFSHWSAYKTHHCCVFCLSFCLVHLVCTFSRLRGLRQSASWPLGEGRWEGPALPGWDGAVSTQAAGACSALAGDVQDCCWQQWGVVLVGRVSPLLRRLAENLKNMPDIFPYN